MTHIENFIYRAMEHHYQQSASIGHKTPTFIKSFVNEEVERGLIKATLEESIPNVVYKFKEQKHFYPSVSCFLLSVVILDKISYKID